MKTPYIFIETLPDMETLGDRLSRKKVLAVDIEADSLHHYLPKVCLIQISSDEETFIIDPLSVQTVEPLKPLLEGPTIKKVFHGADYDLRSLYRDYSIKTENVFDTMIASQLLGEKELGLAAILKKRYGVILNKKFQKANWARRPLPQGMLLYAAHDTADLIRLYRELEVELRKSGRLAWVEEECRILATDCTQGECMEPLTGQIKINDEVQSGENHHHPFGTDSDSPFFFRFKGAGTMKPRDLAVLERILAYRERKAKEKDRPPFKIFGNSIIKELVIHKPTDIEELRKIPGLPDSFFPRYAKGVLKAIHNGLLIEDNQLPHYPRTVRPASNPEKQNRLKLLKVWREDVAKKLKLDPGLVCNNALLDCVAQVNPGSVNDLQDACGMKQWQRKVLGNEIIAILQRS